MVSIRAVMPAISATSMRVLPAAPVMPEAAPSMAPEMLEMEADFLSLPADIVFLVRSQEALENAKLQKVLEVFPRIRVYYDPFVPNVETLARRMYVDPEKLPLILVATGALTAVYACSGYNVGSGDMVVKVCRSVMRA